VAEAYAAAGVIGSGRREIRWVEFFWFSLMGYFLSVAECMHEQFVFIGQFNYSPNYSALVKDEYLDAGE
jgi:hypothetical protein